MSRFMRTFLFSLVCFSLAAVGGVITYSKIFDSKPVPISEEQMDKLDLDIKDPFERAVLESERVNGILLGVNQGMSDVIIFWSLDMKNKKINIMSIPRDTYYHREGYNRAAEKKINAIYSSQGTDKVIDSVQDLLGGKVPIHHYAIVDYKGVEKIVDLVGGVEVDIPMRMNYYDPTDKPPLRISIPKGRQTLNGENAMKSLRFRLNSDGTGYAQGDLGRIKYQQHFMEEFFKKSIGFRLPNVIRTGLEYLETDIKVSQGLSYASRIVGVSGEDLEVTTLPGEAKYIGILSYFIHDPDETQKLIKEIYGLEGEKEENIDKKSDNSNQR